MPSFDELPVAPQRLHYIIHPEVLSILDELAKASRWLRETTVVVPWKVSYITSALTLALTLTLNLKHDTLAPRGSWIYYENTFSVAAVVLG